MDLDLEFLQECLLYNSDTGEFTWKKRPDHHFKTPAAAGTFNTSNAGKIAGWICLGYRIIGITRCGIRHEVRAHRLAFMISGKKVPKYIDHINRDRSDNRLCNLRAANEVDNSANCSAKKNGTSKFLGVYWENFAQRWKWKVIKNYKTAKANYRKDEIEAAKMYDKCAPMFHGRFTNLNFPCLNVQGVQRIIVEGGY